MIQATDEPITAVVIGRAPSSEAARKTVASYAGCRYSAYYAGQEATVVGILMPPSRKRWWAEPPQTDPGLLGLEAARVLVAEHAGGPSRRRRCCSVGREIGATLLQAATAGL